MKKAFLIVIAVLGMYANMIAHSTLSDEPSDKVWNYTVQTKDIYTYDITFTKYDGYHFDGLESIGGMEYAVFRTTDGTPFAYIRQDEGKVYVRNYMGAVQIEDHNVNETANEEYQLYDYSLQPGERFRSVAFWETDLTKDCVGTPIEAEVTKVYTKEFNGMIYRYQEYSMIDATGTSESGFGYSNTVIEGIGPQRGMFCAPQLGWWITARSYSFCFPTSVTTKDGEMLWDDPSGVESVEADANQSTDGTIYDLCGRRVVNPLPGTIYIRDGRKYVAR